MKHKGSLLVLGAIAMTTSLAGCGRAGSESAGPTDYFRGLDVNGDGDVDRFEWENDQGSVFPSTLGFRYCDCDANGRLTWHEYFLGHIHMRHCPATYLYESVSAASADTGADATHEDDALGEDWRTGPLVVRADERVQIYAMPQFDQRDERDVPTHLRRRLPPRPGRYSETDLPSTALKRLKFTSQAVAQTVLVAHYDPSEKIPGNEARMNFPRMICEIDNGNPDVRITMIDLQIVWRLQGHEYRTRLLKTVWADPTTTQSIDVWFASPVDSAECRLLHARGQPAALARNLSTAP
jgi:hypothetical protein